MAVPVPAGSLPRGHALCVIIPPLTLRLAGCSLPFSVGHPRSAGPYSNWTPMRWMRRAARPSSATVPAAAACPTRAPEITKDTWDMALFGQQGRLSYTAITQP